MKEQPEHILLLKWLILTGFIFFTIIAAWNEGVLLLLYTVDKSHISMAITLIYLLVIEFYDLPDPLFPDK
jgi:hypothetical protein